MENKFTYVCHVCAFYNDNELGEEVRPIEFGTIADVRKAIDCDIANFENNGMKWTEEFDISSDGRLDAKVEGITKDKKIQITIFYESVTDETE